MNSDDLIRLYDLIDKAKPADAKDALREAVVCIAGFSVVEGERFRTVEKIESILKGGK